MKKLTYIVAAMLMLITMSAKADDTATQTAAQDVDARTFVVSSTSSVVDYASIGRELANVEEALKSGNVDPRVISKYVSYLGTASGQLQEARKQLDADLKSVNKRIESLGEMPKEGEEELPVIAEKRKEYNEELVFQKGKIAEVDLLINRAEELTTMISSVRKQALIGNLLFYQEPIIYPGNFLRATAEFVNLGFNILKSPITWYGDLSDVERGKVKSNVIPVLLLVAVALSFGIFLRIMIIKHLGYKRHNITGIPPYFTKVIAAMFVACAYGVIPAVMLGGFLVWAVHTKILTVGFFGVVLVSALYYSLYIFLSNAAIRVVFAPYNPKWRLIAMETEKAKRLTKAFYFSFFVIGICAMLQHIANEANSSLELIYYISVISTAVKSLCTVWVIKMFFWDDVIAEAKENDDEETVAAIDARNRRALRVIFLAGLAAVAVICISLFGYPRLSTFIVNRFLFTVLVTVVLLVLRKAVFELIRRLLLFSFWGNRFRAKKALLEKIDFWLHVTINPIFMVIGLLAILTLWGVSTDILLQSIKKLFFGFKVGGVEISLFLIILGIIVFFCSIKIFRILRSKLQDNILSHVEIDDGIKHSLLSGFGFVGVVISVVLAIVVMGGDLSNLALVAGALSVGIGFGLQNIVNNFMSGIILLFERPIKVGDWVKINGEEGKIKQINIRSTEIETFSRASVIIPNATLLSNSVTNMTHGNNWTRFNVSVGVAYGSDVEKVKQILLECAAANRKVLRKPEPYVLFQDFGASSLNFDLRGYSSNIWEGWIIPSELRYEINRRFNEEGIEIPFNQLVVHHADDGAVETDNQPKKSKSTNKKEDAKK